VDREPFSSLTRAAAPPADPEPCDPSRLESPRSWCFLDDLKKKAMAGSRDCSPGYSVERMLAGPGCDVGWWIR
jgi:hypothetical protein